MVTLVRWYVLQYDFGLTIMPAALAAYVLAAAAAGAGIPVERRGEHLWPPSMLGDRNAASLRPYATQSWASSNLVKPVT